MFSFKLILAEILVIFSVHFWTKILVLLLSSQKNEINASLLLMFCYSTAVVMLYI